MSFPWINLKAFDSDEFVTIAKAQIEEFLPVLARQISFDAPQHCGECAYWRVACTRDTFIAVVKSVNGGVLCTHNMATTEDVLRELQRLGANIMRQCSDDSYHKRKRPKETIGDQSLRVCSTIRHTHHTLTLRPTAAVRTATKCKLMQLCSQISYAISRWPRLINAPRPECGVHLASFSCSSTRVWVQFIEKPRSVIEHRRSSVSVVQFLSLWTESRWVRDMLFALMAIRLDILDAVENDTPDKSDQAEAQIFKQVRDVIESNPSGVYWPVTYDSGFRASDDNKVLRIAYVSRERQRVISSSVAQLRAAIAGEESSFEVATATTYVELIKRESASSVCPAALFAADCIDNLDKTVERSALEQAFSNQGMKILKWSDSIDANSSVVPALFPPHANTGAVPAGPHPNPAILISYGEDLQ